MSIFEGTRFIASAHDPRELPPDIGSEIAFAGRSNAGKSSAINALTRRKKLAFVSKTPGRTQTINFFDCGGNRRLVDLPGYGYAKVPLKEREHWGMLISAYLQERTSLKGLVLIVDARHPLTPLDQQLLGWYTPLNQPVLVLLTKADKLNRQEANLALRESQALLVSKFPNATAQLFSAVTGTGLRSAENMVHGWLK
ncbi:MAG: engB [Betaproteobacteria bacterium]|nr:engB [Betaproteobacteria bacterium]